jgi:hypothetical protein
VTILPSGSHSARAPAERGRPVVHSQSLAGQPTIAGDGTQSAVSCMSGPRRGRRRGARARAANRVYNLVGHENTVSGQCAPCARSSATSRSSTSKAAPATFAAATLRRAGGRGRLGAAHAFLDGVRHYVEWVTADAGTPRVATASSTDGRAATVLRQEPAELWVRSRAGARRRRGADGGWRAARSSWCRAPPPVTSPPRPQQGAPPARALSGRRS